MSDEEEQQVTEEQRDNEEKEERTEEPPVVPQKVKTVLTCEPIMRTMPVNTVNFRQCP